MGRSLDEVISKLPSDRQARIASLAENKVDDMLADSTMPAPTSTAAKASNKVRRASASSALKKDDQLKSHRATNPVTTEEKTAKARKQRATPGHQ